MIEFISFVPNCRSPVTIVGRIYSVQGSDHFSLLVSGLPWRYCVGPSSYWQELHGKQGRFASEYAQTMTCSSSLISGPIAKVGLLLDFWYQWLSTVAVIAVLKRRENRAWYMANQTDGAPTKFESLSLDTQGEDLRGILAILETLSYFANQTGGTRWLVLVWNILQVSPNKPYPSVLILFRSVFCHHFDALATTRFFLVLFRLDTPNHSTRQNVVPC